MVSNSGAHTTRPFGCEEVLSIVNFCFRRLGKANAKGVSQFSYSEVGAFYNNVIVTPGTRYGSANRSWESSVKSRSRFPLSKRPTIKIDNTKNRPRRPDQSRHPGGQWSASERAHANLALLPFRIFPGGISTQRKSTGIKSAQTPPGRLAAVLPASLALGEHLEARK